MKEIKRMEKDEKEDRKYILQGRLKVMSKWCSRAVSWKQRV